MIYRLFSTLLIITCFTATSMAQQKPKRSISSEVTEQLSGWITHDECVPRPGQKICDYTPDEHLLGEDDYRVFEFSMIENAIVDPKNDFWKIENMPQVFKSGYNSCSDYIGPDGKFGKKAKMIAKELLSDNTTKSTNRYALFFAEKIPGIEEVCPEFNNFDELARLKFWLYFFTAIAHTESKCGHPKWTHNPNDPQGDSVGDFQLEERWKISKKGRDGSSYTAGRFNRGPGCNATEPAATVRGKTFLMHNWKNNIPCAVEIFGSNLYGCYKNNRRRCTQISRPWSANGLFWAELRRNNSRGKILPKLKKLSLCHPQSPSAVHSSPRPKLRPKRN